MRLRADAARWPAIGLLLLLLPYWLGSAIQAQTGTPKRLYLPLLLCERCQRDAPAATQTRPPIPPPSPTPGPATATRTATFPPPFTPGLPTRETPPPEPSASPTPEPIGTKGACEQLQEAFARHAHLVDVTCDEAYAHVHTETGLPDPNPPSDDHRMMVGITNWILRVAIPFEFRWRLPLEPDWLEEPEEATARGPIGLAIDGVPIFHYERRPDVSTDPDDYDPRHDTVLHGELDQCGGHAGQGDDYHYHYAPVCLMDDHDLDLPIAFGLDGVPLYFGTAGDDYYGRGRTSDIDNLPEGELDKCNAYALPDGSYVYYSTNDPPYTIGCHVAHADPALRIEPRPLRGREQGNEGPYGGRVGEPIDTLVTDYFIDADGWRHMVHRAFSGPGESAVLVRESEMAGDCWDFEFREDAGQAGERETYCR